MQFPSLAGHILGEESTEFTNATGETIEIVLTTSRADTMQMLLRVLNGNEEAAKALVDAVHAVLHETEVDLCGHVFDHVDLPLNDLALWIDPIGRRNRFREGGSSPPQNNLRAMTFSILQTTPQVTLERSPRICLTNWACMWTPSNA